MTQEEMSAVTGVGPVAVTVARSPRVALLDPLRAVAAVSVMWFHFTQGNTVAQGTLRETGRYGWLGVQVFFVISGFVIPYAMYSGGYRIRGHFWRFLIKRLVRLEPPYLISLFLVVGLLYLSSVTPGFRGAAPDVSWPQLLLHFGYLNTFAGYPWLNPVYWTLGIEFQYYIFIALAYPAFVSSRWFVRTAAVAACVSATVLLPWPASVFHYLWLFAFGILAFQHRVGLLTRPTYLLSTMALFAAAWVARDTEGAVVGGATGLAIAFLRLPENRAVRMVAAVGTLSYSLYLVHVPVGGRVCNLAGRYAHGWFEQLVVLIAAVVVSLLVSFALHRLVERPCQQLSSRIRYE